MSSKPPKPAPKACNVQKHPTWCKVQQNKHHNWLHLAWIGPVALIAVFLIASNSASLFGFGSGITIDGKMLPGEWNGAKYKAIPFWLNVDNTPDPATRARNVNGWNYFYLAQDTNNYYIGLDMCSQRIASPKNEQLNVYLANGSIMPQVSGSLFGFQAMRGHGLDFVNFNSSTNASEPRQIVYGSSTATHDIPFVPGVDSYSMTWGNATGNYADLWRDDSQNFTIASHFGNEFAPSFGLPRNTTNTNFAMINFVFNMSSIFPKGYESNFINPANLTNMYLDTSLTATLGDHGAWENTNHTNIFACVESDSDPSKLSAINDWTTLDATTVQDDFTFTANKINMQSMSMSSALMDANHMWHVSLFFWNENGSNTNFTVSIDRLSIGVKTSAYSGYYDTSLPTTSYDVKYSFSATENLAVPHRVYEIRISKATLPGRNLNVYIAGELGGNPSFSPAGTNFWFYPSTTFDLLGLISGTFFPVFDGGFGGYPF